MHQENIPVYDLDYSSFMPLYKIDINAATAA